MPNISYYYLLPARFCARPGACKLWPTSQLQPAVCFCAKSGQFNGLRGGKKNTLKKSIHDIKTM